MATPASGRGQWTSPEAHSFIKSTLTEVIPQWPDGPHEWQIEATTYILGRNDQVITAACGDGKTAAMYLHLLLIQALKNRQEPCPFGGDLPDSPVVLDVTPLIDLAHSQVAEMTRMGVRAVSLDKKTVQKARTEGRNLLKEVSRAHWPVVIVSPERLTSPEFDRILRDPFFRSCLVLAVIDEAHVVRPWAAEFRESYGEINCLRARLPPDTPFLVMSASLTLDAERGLTQLMGIGEGAYHAIRRSCERPNLRMVFRTLRHGINGEAFPDIAWTIKKPLKTIIYCASIDLGFRVASYLWRLLPEGDERYQTVRLYNALTEDDNPTTLEDFRDDPLTHIIIATVKFGMGVDLRHVDFSINLGLPTSAEAILQQNGRAGRDHTSAACGVTYVEPTVMSSLSKIIQACGDEVAYDGQRISEGRVLERDLWQKDLVAPKATHKAQSKNVPKVTVAPRKGATAWQDDPLLRRAVLCHGQRCCLVAEFNRLFGRREEGASHEHQSCITSNRHLPCSSCLYHRPELDPLMHPREGIIAASSSDTNIDIPSHPVQAEDGPYPEDAEDEPLVMDASTQEQVNHPKLTEKMLKEARAAIQKFSRHMWASKDGPELRFLPHTSFIPAVFVDALLKNFHLIRDREELAQHLFGWRYLEADGHALFDEIRRLNTKFDDERKKALEVRTLKTLATRRRNAANKKRAEEEASHKRTVQHGPAGAQRDPTSMTVSKEEAPTTSGSMQPVGTPLTPNRVSPPTTPSKRLRSGTVNDLSPAPKRALASRAKENASVLASDVRKTSRKASSGSGVRGQEHGRGRGLARGRGRTRGQA